MLQKQQSQDGNKNARDVFLHRGKSLSKPQHFNSSIPELLLLLRFLVMVLAMMFFQPGNLTSPFLTMLQTALLLLTAADQKN